MQPIFAAARKVPAERSRIVYAEGEGERVLRAVQIVVDEKLATPILVGRPAVIERGIKRYGLRIRTGEHFTVVNPEHDERYREYWQDYHKLTERNGVTAQYAKLEMRRRTTLIAAMLLKKGEADGLICGTISTTARHLHYIDQVIGRRPGVNVYGAMSGLVLPGRQVFIVDTHVNLDPTAEQLAEITQLAADQLCAFGLVPKVALLSHSNFGSSDAPSALKMRADLGACCTSACRIWKWMAKCMATAHWMRPRAEPFCRTAPCTAAPTCWCAPISTAPTSPTTCSNRRPATMSPSDRFCSAARRPCTF